MSVHHTSIQWKRQPHKTDANTFSRNHVAILNGEQEIDVSSSPEFFGDPNCADPEQLLITALSSCHMLFFLAIADFQGYKVATYRDNATGYLEKSATGVTAITRIELAPQVTFTGDKVPDAATLAKIHASAHKNCFIAKSLTAQVTIR